MKWISKSLIQCTWSGTHIMIFFQNGQFHDNHHEARFIPHTIIWSVWKPRKREDINLPTVQWIILPHQCRGWSPMTRVESSASPSVKDGLFLSRLSPIWKASRLVVQSRFSITAPLWEYGNLSKNWIMVTSFEALSVKKQ